MTTRLMSQCHMCEHFRPPLGGGEETCAAFPDGGPQDLLWNRVDHRDAVSGDHGITWKSHNGADFPTEAFVEEKSFRKHRPGGRDHDQSSHGRRRGIPTPDLPAAVAVVDPPKPRRQPKPKPKPDRPKPVSRSYEGPSWSLPKGVSRRDATEFRALAARQEAGDDLDFDEGDRLFELKDKLPPAVVARVLNEVAIDKSFDGFRAKLAPGTDPDKLKARMAESLKEAVDGKPVGVRMSPVGLQRMLDAGRYKTQHESNASSALLDPGARKVAEGANFGLPDNLDPGKRPVYGYVMVDGIRPAGQDPETVEGFGDMLSQYGRVQVVLKPEVESRTTMMVGDSLNDHTKGRPSPMSDPDWRSFTFTTRQGLIDKPLATLDRDYGSDEFRGYQYVEAQVHGGVTVDDIAEVVLAEPPTGALRQQLERSGLSWRVLGGDQ